MGRGKQIELELRTWGGRRKGAGRPPKGPRSSERHERRPALKASTPVHVTLRVADDVGRLRTKHAFRAVQRALARSLERTDFRICHVSIQGNHLHLIVEADDERALARGMQAFQISCARHLNAEISRATGRPRTGTVFVDRYHAEPLETPRQVHNALAYVLNNFAPGSSGKGEAMN